MVDASLRATILESLLTLRREFGISFVYITHDLTTAYQVADRLIVLYQGGVTEAGAVQPVVREPQHPYTQLLVRSIPSTNPDQGWISNRFRCSTRAMSKPVMAAGSRPAARTRCRSAPQRRRRCMNQTAPRSPVISIGTARCLPSGDLTGILTESEPVAAVSQ